jgi:pimeloyl-ACP methyl ester carboxylesterase
MPFITAKDGTQLFWRQWGQGAPILFLTSLGCNSQMVGLPDCCIRGAGISVHRVR